MHPLKIFTKHLQQKENTCYVSKKEKLYTEYNYSYAFCKTANNLSIRENQKGINQKINNGHLWVANYVYFFLYVFHYLSKVSMSINFYNKSFI